MKDERFIPTDKRDFRIGATVMCNFGKYGREAWEEGLIVDETKTMWKVDFESKKEKFMKASLVMYGSYGAWSSTYLQCYKESIILEQKRKNLYVNLKAKLNEVSTTKLSIVALRSIWKTIKEDLGE